MGFFIPLILIILVFIFHIVYMILASFVDARDRDEITRVNWLNPTDPVHPSHAVYIVSFKVENTTDIYTNFDMYIRLRGVLGDSPLILYRDFEENLHAGASFNFGVHLPTLIGPIFAIDLVFDHPSALDEEYLITLHDFQVRDAWWVPWADVGTPKFAFANTFTFTARSASIRIDLEYHKQKFGYKQIHYLWGYNDENRLPWSNMSKLDTVLTMTVDLLTVFLIAILLNFFEINAMSANDTLFSNQVSGIATAIGISLLTAEAAGLACSFFSVLWWRIFQKLGGKGIDAQVNVIYDEEEEIDLYPSTATQLMMRTIECTSMGKGYSTAVARKMRVEPLPTNCSSAEINPQTVTYVRTKMTRLTQDPTTLKGRISTNINRMQTCRPTKSDRGTGNKISGMRFTSENTEQYQDKIFHNNVVCELYRASTGAKWGTTEDGDGLADSASVAEMIFHFSDDGFKDKTPQEWAMHSQLRGHKQKGLQGLSMAEGGKNRMNNDDEHWFGRRSTVARRQSTPGAHGRETVHNRFTFFDNFRRAPRMTTMQPTTFSQNQSGRPSGNWTAVNHMKEAMQKQKLDHYDQPNTHHHSGRRSTIRFAGGPSDLEKIRLSTAVAAQQNNLTTDNSGYLDNPLGGSSILRRKSLSHNHPTTASPARHSTKNAPFPSMGTPRETKVNESEEILITDSMTYENLETENENDSINTIPFPSGFGRRNDYAYNDPYLDEKAENAFIYNEDLEENNGIDFTQHPLPNENGGHSIYRWLIFAILVIILLVANIILLALSTNLGYASDAKALEKSVHLSVTLLICWLIYRFQFSFIIASFQLFIERVLF